ncbi:MAG: S9 family peptidase [Phycisphaerae bacterium]|nr:S9 family peptidase [Phycisphaerae bacterium]
MDRSRLSFRLESVILFSSNQEEFIVFHKPAFTRLPVAALLTLSATVHGFDHHADSKPAAAKETTVEAHDQPLIPREVLFGNPERASVQMSPDGKHIAYLAPHEGVLNIWVTPVGEDAPRPITEFSDRPLGGFSWSWNNDQILFGRDDKGDENTHVYAVGIHDLAVKDLTPFDNVNARVAERSHERPDEILVAINDRDPRVHDYYIINTRTGERTLLQENEGEYAAYMFDHDWNPRARVEMTSDGGALYQMKHDGEWNDFLKVDMEDALTTQPMGFNAAGDKIYALDSRGRDKAALVEISAVPGGADAPRVIHESETANVSGVVMNPTTHEPEVAMVEYLRSEWIPLDPAMAAELETIRKIDDGDMSIASRTLDDRTWTLRFMQDDGPVRFWIWNRDDQKGTYLFSHRPELEDYELASMQPVEIKTRDGLIMPSYLTRPLGADEATPMVLLVHGGPWARDRWGYNPMHQWLANRGYAVLSPNFRGSTGFGKAFTNAGNREWYGKMQDDLVDATQWAIDNDIAQKDQIAIMGGSYGGYATLAGLTRDPELFAAGVDIVGPSHVGTLMKTIPPYWEPIISMFETRVGSLDDPEYLDSISPLMHVDRIQRPLIIAQGANDPRVKISESDQIVEAMQSRDLPVTYIVFPDEGHGMNRPENMMAFNAITEEFLAKHLGGRAEAIGETVAMSNAQIRSKGNLALEGIEVWESDGSEEVRPEREPVELSSLTPEEVAKVQMALDQLKQFPPDQLPMLLMDLDRRRATVPAEDLAAFDYLYQEIERMMDAETRKADVDPAP